MPLSEEEIACICKQLIDGIKSTETDYSLLNWMDISAGRIYLTTDGKVRISMLWILWINLMGLSF